MANPEGYRKALRLFKMAERFSIPILTFIDTPGAYPGLEAEEHGQGEAIARNLMEMSGLKVPIISVVIGKGEVAEHLDLEFLIEYLCWKIQYIQSFHQKVVQQYYIKMLQELKRQQRT